MLQKELNHQQVQPRRRRKNKSFQRKESEQQSPQQSWPPGETFRWGGRGHLGSKSSPTLSSAGVHVIISYTFGSLPGFGRIPEITWSSSAEPVTDWRRTGISPSCFIPDCTRAQWPSGQPRWNVHTFLKPRLSLSYSESLSPSSLGRLSCTVSSGDTSRKSTRIPQPADAPPLRARLPIHAAVFTVVFNQPCSYLPNSLGAGLGIISAGAWHTPACFSRWKANLGILAPSSLPLVPRQAFL